MKPSQFCWRKLWVNLFWHSNIFSDVTGKSKEFCCVVYSQLDFSCIGPGSSFKFCVCIYDRQFIDNRLFGGSFVPNIDLYHSVKKKMWSVPGTHWVKCNGREKLLPTFMNHSHNSVFPISRYISCKKIRFPISTNGLAI